MKRIEPNPDGLKMDETSHKPRNVGDFQKLEKAGKTDSPPSLSLIPWF